MSFGYRVSACRVLTPRNCVIVGTARAAPTVWSTPPLHRSQPAAFFYRVFLSLSLSLSSFSPRPKAVFLAFRWVSSSFYDFPVVSLSLAALYWASLGFTGFYRVWLVYTRFYWVLLGFFPICCLFFRVLIVFISFSWVLVGFTRFYWVLLHFYLVLLGFIGSNRVILGFHLLLMNSTRFYWILLGWTDFLSHYSWFYWVFI